MRRTLSRLGSFITTCKTLLTDAPHRTSMKKRSSMATTSIQDLRQGRAMALTWPDPALLSAVRPRPDPTLLNGPGR